MKASDIIALTAAGWSRAEILQLGNALSTEQPAQQTQQPVQQTQQPVQQTQQPVQQTQQPVQQLPSPPQPPQQAAAPAWGPYPMQAPVWPPVVQPQQAAQPDQLTQLLQGVNNLTTTLQAQAIRQDQLQPPQTPEQLAEATLASIINPPLPEAGK